jgi:hypothetical protein
MAEGDRKNWRESCSAALEAKDPDELLKIVQQINQVLKCEEQIRRDFREESHLLPRGARFRYGVVVDCLCV